MLSPKISIFLTSLLISIQIPFAQQIAQAQTTQTTEKTSTTSICSNQIQSSINNIINRPEFTRMRWGILIKPLNSEQKLYNLESEKYFIPASTNKLFTTAAALKKLGRDFKIRTSIYQDAEGTLRVVGRGDPSLKTAQLDILSQQLYQRGIREIDQLIADDSYFQGEVVNPSWQWEDVQFYYGAPVNSLIVNENAAVINFVSQKIGEPLKIQWTNFLDSHNWNIQNNTITTAENQPGFVAVYRDLKGQILRIKGQLPVNAKPDITAIAVFDPADNFLRHFRGSLLKAGIKVKQVSVKNSGNISQEIAFLESPSLSELIKEINGNSNNLFTEAILKTLGSQQPLKDNQTTVDSGLEVVKNTLTELGVDPKSYIIVDGSGLSRKNLISPESLVQVLQIMGTSNQGEIFRASLPVAGVSGTLKNRFLNTSAQGIVQAKTGTMMGVVTLSGYVNNTNYQPLVFSIMVNQSDQPASIVRNAMDEIVVLLSQLKRC
ncbi:MAG: D-alanyl-D-alanine carboxypeptidase/D-alanyl-D-alanine-endopeptidase [Nostocales cyanobacterium]|nr:MAG: D-alanyl-D-alanine carboxypeptidase/D-alanyl-D-alanine-endopeptidase [Nostocales cyanobacterium]TAF20676.1 MAG: D-alanyl-D-alanine carboxypeptidase/D-alanyl-D-alanine-endopeptidase [Nostocales cyanobacterium]